MTHCLSFDIIRLDMDGTGRKTHKWRRRLLIAAVAVVLAAAAFVLSIPFLPSLTL